MSNTKTKRHVYLSPGTPSGVCRKRGCGQLFDSQVHRVWEDDTAVRAVVEATDPAPNPVPPPSVSAAELRDRANRKDNPR